MCDARPYRKRFAARALTSIYVNHKRLEDREEILLRVNEKGGPGLQVNWEDSETQWLSGVIDNGRFMAVSINMMPTDEEPPPPNLEPPDDF